MIKCLGIDPGLATTGVGIVLGQDFDIKSYSFGSITTSKDMTLPARLNHIFDKISALIEKQTSSISPELPFNEVIAAVSKGRQGAVAVLSSDKKVIGIITDGDIRRALKKGKSLFDAVAADFMSTNPILADANILAADALDLISEKNISQLIVTEEGLYKGIVHFHDLLKEGL